VTTRSAAAQQLRDLVLLRRVRDRIDREFAQLLDVEALARGVHLSAGHLSRQFRLSFSTRFTELVGGAPQRLSASGGPDHGGDVVVWPNR
jgi:AraC-like DNA-binding protein